MVGVAQVLGWILTGLAGDEMAIDLDRVYMFDSEGNSDFRFDDLSVR